MMTKNKLSAVENVGWGEDLVHIRSKGGELAKQAESKILAEYLIAIRGKLESDHQLGQLVVDSKPAIGAKAQLLDLLHELIMPNTEDLFEQAVMIVLNELDQFREKEPSLYLINRETGMAIMPIPQERIPNSIVYTSEENRLNKIKPMLHPGIVSSLALAGQESSRLQKALDKAKDPVLKSAYAHLVCPDAIVEMTKEKLLHIGMVLDEDIDALATNIEFGYENADDIYQSPNIHFHRAHLLSSILVRRIVKLSSNGHFYVDQIRVRKNSKQKWYSAQVRVT